MADMMQYDLVSPERRLASGEASAVQLPGTDGDLTAMANHAPTITTLRPGIVKVSGAQGETRFVVTGGFAEIGPEGASVLAERAVAVEELTQPMFDDFVAAAVSARDHATDELKDELAKQVADIAAIGAELGFTAKL